MQETLILGIALNNEESHRWRLVIPERLKSKVSETKEMALPELIVAMLSSFRRPTLEIM